MKEFQVHEATVTIDNGTVYQFETCSGEVYAFKIPKLEHQCEDK